MYHNTKDEPYNENNMLREKHKKEGIKMSVIGAVDGLLNDLFDEIQNAKSVPLSTEKCIIEREKMLDNIENILSYLPAEMKEAIQIVECRQELLAKAQESANQIVEKAQQEYAQMSEKMRADAESAKVKTREEARRVLEEAHKKAQELVTQEAVYQEAQKQAQELLDATKRKIEELKKVSNQYMVESLKETEEAVAAALKNVQATRAKFDNMVATPKKAEPPKRNNSFVDIDL